MLSDLFRGIEAKAPRSWTLDGKRILFETHRTGNHDIYTIDRDGMHLTRLTESPAGDGSPSLSPDGSRIAFNSSRDGNAEVYVMRSDASQQVRLTNTSAEERSPAWLPDGARIAFTTQPLRR